MQPIQLDERLSLAMALFPACEEGADIGTDHGRLPCRLLEEGRCRRMILSDISPKALSRAEALVQRRGLQGRATLVVADGLDALTHRVDCVSIMGMGGRTIAQALRRGQERLAGASLVLSAHTELPEVRQAVEEIGYHLIQERLCRAGNRWYVFLKAIPGATQYTPLERLVGPCLMREGDPLLAGYAAWRKGVWAARLTGLHQAEAPDDAQIRQAQEAVAAYETLSMKEAISC